MKLKKVVNWPLAIPALVAGAAAIWFWMPWEAACGFMLRKPQLVLSLDVAGFVLAWTYAALNIILALFGIWGAAFKWLELGDIPVWWTCLTNSRRQVWKLLFWPLAIPGEAAAAAAILVMAGARVAARVLAFDLNKWG